MMPQYGNLIITAPDGSQQTIGLDNAVLTFGSAGDNSLQLEGPQVSAYHGRLECDERGCLLVNVGSSGGIFVNGQSVQRAALKGNDILQIGRYRVTFVAPAPVTVPVVDDGSTMPMTAPAPTAPAPMPAPTPAPTVVQGAGAATREPDEEPQRRRGLVWMIGLLVVVCLLATAAGAYFFGDQLGIQLPFLASGPSVEYVLDGSYRMTFEENGRPRIESAKSAVLMSLQQPAVDQMYAGFRVFGNGQGGVGCEDTALLNFVEQNNAGPIAGSVNELWVSPQEGPVPLTEAIVQGINDLGTKPAPQTLVVITAGPDSCYGNSNELIQQAVVQSGVDLQMVVIGYQASEGDAEVLRDLAGAVPGGTYMDAKDTDGLTDILGQVQRRAGNSGLILMPPPAGDGQGAGENGNGGEEGDEQVAEAVCGNGVLDEGEQCERVPDRCDEAFQNDLRELAGFFPEWCRSMFNGWTDIESNSEAGAFCEQLAEMDVEELPEEFARFHPDSVGESDIYVGPGTEPFGDAPPEVGPDDIWVKTAWLDTEPDPDVAACIGQLGQDLWAAMQEIDDDHPDMLIDEMEAIYFEQTVADMESAVDGIAPACLALDCGAGSTCNLDTCACEEQEQEAVCGDFTLQAKEECDVDPVCGTEPGWDNPDNAEACSMLPDQCAEGEVCEDCACVDFCGNGVVSGDEECDGSGGCGSGMVCAGPDQGANACQCVRLFTSAPQPQPEPEQEEEEGLRTAQRVWDCTYIGVQGGEHTFQWYLHEVVLNEDDDVVEDHGVISGPHTGPWQVYCPGAPGGDEEEEEESSPSCSSGEVWCCSGSDCYCTTSC